MGSARALWLGQAAAHSSTRKNSTISSGESGLKLPVERRLPGTPIPREQLLAEWEDLHHRNLMKGPVASFLFDFH